MLWPDLGKIKNTTFLRLWVSDSELSQLESDFEDEDAIIFPQCQRDFRHKLPGLEDFIIIVQNN